MHPILLLAALHGTALAGDAGAGGALPSGSDDTTSTSETPAEPSGTPAKADKADKADKPVDTEHERPFHHEVSFRGRMLTIPDSILDIWYFNEDDEGWPLDKTTDPRPQAKGYSLGLEYCIKGPAANGIFYFDYADSTMQPGYWDDVEEPADHLDGSYLAPTKNFGLVVFGADFGYEVHFVKTEQTNGNFGLSLVPGAGLGVGVLTGHIDEWRPDDQGHPAYQLYDEGKDPTDELRIPKVVPVLDINLALRFNFANRAVIRIEGGLHELVYYGATVGIMF